MNKPNWEANYPSTLAIMHGIGDAGQQLAIVFISPWFARDDGASASHSPSWRMTFTDMSCGCRCQRIQLVYLFDTIIPYSSKYPSERCLRKEHFTVKVWHFLSMHSWHGRSRSQHAGSIRTHCSADNPQGQASYPKPHFTMQLTRIVVLEAPRHIPNAFVLLVSPDYHNAWPDAVKSSQLRTLPGSCQVAMLTTPAQSSS